MKQTSFEDYAVKGVRAYTAFFSLRKKVQYFICFLSVFYLFCYNRFYFLIFSSVPACYGMFRCSVVPGFSTCGLTNCPDWHSISHILLGWGLCLLVLCPTHTNQACLIKLGLKNEKQ